MNTPETLLAELDRTDAVTRALLDDLSDEQLAVPYHRGINPPLWELGHAAFFYEYFLLRERDGIEPRMPGYDEIWDSFETHHQERWEPGVVPDERTTRDYYERIIDETRRRILGRDLIPEELYLYKYCIFHQHMHLESLIWARQTLGYPAPVFLGSWADDGKRGERGDVTVPAGTYPMGMPAGTDDFAAEGFAFDNEKPGFTQEVEEFAISRTLVSNGEFAAFLEDGGYGTDALWSHNGKRWLGANEAAHPAYWRRGDDGWEVRRFDQWRPMNPELPLLHVSYWEAEAWCRWAGRRLPTEAEWEAAARGTEGRLFPWGDTMDAERVVMDGTLIGEVPVDGLPTGATPAGCLQMVGTAWEWTTNQYLPYPGFTVDMYPYMSTLQFGYHKVTKGGSGATSSPLIRNTYRQAYFPDRTDAYTGFRTVAG